MATATVMAVDERLESELDAWASAGLTARLWWRDDDAAADTPALRRLLGLAEQIGVQVALGVIPEKAEESLVELVSASPCCVWQHGWGHHFHRFGEFGEGRPLDVMEHEALSGQRRLDRMFGPAGWQRVFVPPNHVISMPFKARLPGLGFVGLSAGVQLCPQVQSVTEINAEVDVMAWYEKKALPMSAICAMVAEQLRSRQLGQVPQDRPVGILTHHQAFDDEAWDTVARLLRFLDAHGAVEMARPDTLFEPQRAATAAKGQGWPTAAGAADPQSDVTVVLTSCGREDLLRRTLDSFVKYNTYPIREFIVMEDGETTLPVAFDARYRDYDIKSLCTGKRVGQIPAVDAAYRLVKTPYIFHCEDDWEFIAPGFIEKSMHVLEHNSDVLQVWLRAVTDTNKHPVLEWLFFAGDTSYRILQPVFDSEKWGRWHGFSFNPGLRRRSDWLLLGSSFGALDPLQQKKSHEIEREASAFYYEHGLRAAILADDPRGYVKHIGWRRRVDPIA